jgi:hypothetical protein
MKHTTAMFALLGGLLFIGPLGAETIRLDDSLTHTVPPNARMQWRPVGLVPADGLSMEAGVRVNGRIDTRPVANRAGTLYLMLERDEASSIEVQWTSQGRLDAGALRSGERAAVFSGVAPPERLEDQLLMRLRSGADWQSESRRLRFHFEFDAQ